MRILCGLRSLVGGGVERTALVLQRQLCSRSDVWLALMENYGELLESEGDCPNLLLPRGNRGTPPQREDLWFAIRALPRVVRYAARLRKLRRQLRPQVLFTHSGVDLLAAGRLVPRAGQVWAAGVGSDLMRHMINQQPWLEPVWRLILGVLYRGPDLLVTASQGLRRALIEELWLNPDRIRVIPNPVDLERVQLLARQPLEVSRPFVLGVGRLSYYKGFDVLVRAMTDLPYDLVVLGEGEERNRLESLGHPRLALPGFVENPWAYMSQAAAVVVPSRLEGFSNVTVEALACGAPVIVTDCPHGPREIVDEGRYGLVVGRDDPAALRAALGRLLEDRDLSQGLRAGGPARAAAYSAPQVALQYLDFFTSFRG